MKLRLLYQEKVCLHLLIGCMLFLVTPKIAIATDANLTLSDVSGIEIAGRIVVDRVVAEDGMGLQGATLWGSTNGALTGEIGSHTISISDGGATLTISYIDYQTQEIVPHDRRDLLRAYSVHPIYHTFACTDFSVQFQGSEVYNIDNIYEDTKLGYKTRASFNMEIEHGNVCLSKKDEGPISRRNTKKKYYDLVVSL